MEVRKKMKKTIQMLLIGLLVMAMPFAAAMEENGVNKRGWYNRLKAVDVSNALELDEELTQEEAEERIQLEMPESLEAAQENAESRLGRFILYTHDGKNVMWGFFGNHYFYGEDNNGKVAYGIYGNHIFAGFYDGEFFWGKYRRGHFKAEGLFGEDYSRGRYVTFPIA